MTDPISNFFDYMCECSLSAQRAWLEMWGLLPKEETRSVFGPDVPLFVKQQRVMDEFRGAKDLVAHAAAEPAQQPSIWRHEQAPSSSFIISRTDPLFDLDLTDAVGRSAKRFADQGTPVTAMTGAPHLVPASQAIVGSLGTAARTLCWV